MSRIELVGSILRSRSFVYYKFFACPASCFVRNAAAPSGLLKISQLRSGAPKFSVNSFAVAGRDAIDDIEVIR